MLLPLPFPLLSLPAPSLCLLLNPVPVSLPENVPPLAVPSPPLRYFPRVLGAAINRRRRQDAIEASVRRAVLEIASLANSAEALAHLPPIDFSVEARMQFGFDVDVEGGGEEESSDGWLKRLLKVGPPLLT